MQGLESSQRPAATTVASSLHQECHLCGSHELAFEFMVDRWPLLLCRQCGLLFLSTVPDGDGAEPAGEASDGVNSPVYELHASNASARMERLVGYAGPELRQLLLIANDSFLYREARRRGIEVTACSAGEVDRGMLATLSAAAFDAAVFQCTLERLRHPELTLSAVKSRLKPGGALMVIAPTIDSRTARLFGAGWWEFNRRNLHYFTADTLQSLLLKNGFGDPIIEADDSAVSLEYFRARLPDVPSAALRELLRLLITLTPPPLRRRAFRSLNSRRIVFVRSQEPAPIPTLSVVVPAYNEKATLCELMNRVLAKSIEGLEIEIVLVESNSSDGTRDDAVRFGQHPRVKLILEERPRGKGHAVRAGLAACTGDIVLIQDADLEYDVDDYDALVAPLLAYRRNFVIGSRHTSAAEGWKIRKFNQSTMLSAVYNLGHVVFLRLFNTLYRQRLKDPFSMFKVFRRDCLYGLVFESNRFDFDFEIVIKLLRKGYQPVELPVNYTARSPAEGKKVRFFFDPLTWLRALVKFRWSRLYNEPDAHVTSERRP